MPVTEIALLNIKETDTDPVPSNDGIPGPVSKDLYKAIREQATYSGYPVALVQCTTDFTKIFLVGGWDSVSHHMDDWIPGPVNQSLLKLLSLHVEVEWMFHLDIDPLRVLEAVRGEKGNDRMRASIGIFVTDDGQKSECEAMLQEVASGFECGKAMRVLRAWRVDLGYVAESAQSEMQKVGNTLVSFAANEEDETLIPRKLQNHIRNESIYSTRTVAFVEKDEKTREWRELAR